MTAREKHFGEAALCSNNRPHPVLLSINLCLFTKLAVSSERTVSSAGLVTWWQAVSNDRVVAVLRFQNP